MNVAMLAEAPTLWSVVSQAITVGGTVLLAWIAYSQHKLNKGVKEIGENTNSMKDALVKTTGESELAKGKLEGAKEEQAKIALKAEGAKEAKDAEGKQ